MKRLFTLLFVLLLCVSIVVADTDGTADSGISEEFLDACGTACTYEDGTLTLSEGAELQLGYIPSNVVIEIEDATVTLPSGDTLSSGSFDTSTMTLTNGELKVLDGSDLDLTFAGTTVTTALDHATISGNGVVENGQVKLIESGEVTVQGSAAVYVENLHDLQFERSAVVDERKISSGDVMNRDILMIGRITDDTKIGTSDTGFVTMSASGDDAGFVFGKNYLSCTTACNYDITGNPGIFIEGSGLKYDRAYLLGEYVWEDDPTTELGYVEKLEKRSVYNTEVIHERTFSFDGGKQHTFEGSVYTMENGVTIADPPEFTLPYVTWVDKNKRTHVDTVEYLVQSIDGVYFSRGFHKVGEELHDTKVQVFFDKEIPLMGNAVGMYSDTISMTGNDYKVAFGDVMGGNPSNDFPFTFTSQNPYVINKQQTEAASRFIVGMEGGSATVSSQPAMGYYGLDVRIMDIAVEEPGITVLNGVSTTEYVEDAYGNIAYNFAYAGCDRITPGPNLHVACGEIGVDQFDGGHVNVLSEEGTGFAFESKEVTLDFHTEGLREKDNPDEYTLFPADHRYDLNTGKIYALGYLGGEVPKMFLGAKDEYKDYGHVGLMYYRDGEWWVHEQDGRNAVVRPLENSLFSKKLHGVWEVNVDDPLTTIATLDRTAGSVYKAWDPTSSWTGPARGSIGGTCVSHCVQAVNSGIREDMSHGLSFTDLEEKDVDLGWGAWSAQVLGNTVEGTPRWFLVDNPLLTRVHDQLGQEVPLLGGSALAAAKGE